MIKAIGKKNGSMIEVSYDGNNFLFNDTQDDMYEHEMKRLLFLKFPIGGTYRTENMYEPINIIEVLRNHFFDKPIDDDRIKTSEPIEEIPTYDIEDIVY